MEEIMKMEFKIGEDNIIIYIYKEGDTYSSKVEKI